jgi:preprotein translocase SecE subunit
LLWFQELLILTGKVQPDRFSGGLRFNVQQISDLAEARCRHARFLRVVVGRTLPPLDAVLAAHPPKQEDTEFGETLTRGVPVRLRIVREQAVGDIDLGERSRFWPSDEALAQWAALLVLLGGAVAVFFTSEQGKALTAYGRESVREFQKVVWPTRKEAGQMTGYVFAFVVVIGLRIMNKKELYMNARGN